MSYKKCVECKGIFKLNFPYGIKSAPLIDGEHAKDCPNKRVRGLKQFLKFRKRFKVEKEKRKRGRRVGKNA